MYEKKKSQGPYLQIFLRCSQFSFLIEYAINYRTHGEFAHMKLNFGDV